MHERYHYDDSYSYLKQTLVDTEKFSFNVRDSLRDYLRVFLPLRLKPGNKLLDIGSCIGSLGHHFKYAGIKTTGIDLNHAAILAGRQKYGYERSNQSLVSNGTALPFATYTFDAVVSQDVFEHLNCFAEAELMLTEIERILKPDTKRMFHKITVLEDSDHIHADDSHYLKWTTAEWIMFFDSKGWRSIQNPTRQFPIMSNVSHGNFLLERK